MEDIIRERLVVLHQDIDSLNTEASVDALGVEGHSRQLQQTGAAIEALKGVLQQAEHEKVPPKPEPPGLMRVFVEGHLVGVLDGYRIDASGMTASLKLELRTTNEMVHELTKLAAERETLLGRIEPDAKSQAAWRAKHATRLFERVLDGVRGQSADVSVEQEARVLLDRAGSAADDRVALGDRDTPKPVIVVHPWVTAIAAASSVSPIQFRGQFGTYALKADSNVAHDEFRIEDDNG